MPQEWRLGLQAVAGIPVEASNESIDGPAIEGEARPRIAVGKLIKWGIFAALVAIAATVGWRYWRHAQLYVSTDNAYVNANMVQIAAQVSGPIIAIHVQDQQHVKAGDLLFEIDPRPY
jgi:membrane fusion protein, multidrug efflux system